MSLSPLISAELHKYRTKEIRRAADQIHLTPDNVPDTSPYSLWGYTMMLVKNMRFHVEPLT